MKVSIIITSCNYGRYIERCIRSCLNQEHVNGLYEIIIVDDASTDDTLKIIKRYVEHRVSREDPIVTLISNEQNLGVAETSNIGIRAARGQYVVRVDADDYISEKFVYMLSEFLEANHDAFGARCDYQLVDEQENVLERRYASRNPISCGVLYKKDLFTAVGLYNADFRHCEEEELRRRLGDRYKIIDVALPLYRYRMHSSNKTKQSEYQKVLSSFDEEE